MGFNSVFIGLCVDLNWLKRSDFNENLDRLIHYFIMREIKVQTDFSQIFQT